MEPGTTVRLKADPGRVGSITGNTRQRAGITLWQVRFSDGFDYCREVQLEKISDTEDDPILLLKEGKLGRAKDLRGALTYIRLNGRLANLIYSMDTTNTDFYAYQFKPVLNFLDSPGNGLLIADEVGLGKTIEAGLIWTELKSRYDIRKVMVLCPAMLQEKWEAELKRRFGISAEILPSKDALKRLKKIKTQELSEFAMICSMQGLRPRRGWDNIEEQQDTASILCRFLNDNQFEEPFIDLLIIDEAHYLRNPESMTSRLGRLLRDVSEHVLLLSATPIHLRNRDLYQLLNLVDENTFNQPAIFDEILAANEPIIRTRDAVLQSELSQSQFIELLKKALEHPFFSENRQIRSLLDKPPSDDVLRDRAFRTNLANRLEAINLLGKTVNRTRKRHVTEWRVIRDPFAEAVPLSDPERKFYNCVTDLVREYALRHTGVEGFLLVMPQRQMSSSMPAALEEWKRRGVISNETIYEAFGIQDYEGDVGPLTQELINNAHLMGDLDELKANDSKYKRLVLILNRYLKDFPDEKIVLFSYFRPTLKYLHSRLQQDGISSALLMGGMKYDKYSIIDFFQSKEGPQILLSSEVASEGVDLQFSNILINYDLPWNPMKVEQRIGRLDRLGQKSSRITIWNLFYQETIDARIYVRLFQRLGIFERALGGLEAILGEEIRKLTIDLLKRDLTPDEEQMRIEQTAQALSVLKEEEEKLEAEANNLMAHGDYILHQVNAARELERTITGHDIWIYVKDYLTKEYVGTEFIQINPNELLFDVTLSSEAKFDLESFVKEMKLQGQTRLADTYASKIRCRFDNKVGFLRPGKEEIISQWHPLVRFISNRIKKLTSFPYYSPVSLHLPHFLSPDISPGIYVFVVERWSVQGVREIEHLKTTAAKYQENTFFLQDNQAEKLVTTAGRKGADWLSALNELNLSATANIVDDCFKKLENEYEEYVEQIENENNDRADIQERSLRAHQERQLEKLYQMFQQQSATGKENIARMTKGRIDSLKSRMNFKLSEINRRRKLVHHRKEVCIGLIKLL